MRQRQCTVTYQPGVSSLCWMCVFVSFYLRQGLDLLFESIWCVCVSSWYKCVEGARVHFRGEAKAPIACATALRQPGLGSACVGFCLFLSFLHSPGFELVVRVDRYNVSVSSWYKCEC